MRWRRVSSAASTAWLLACRLRFCWEAVSTQALASFGAGTTIGRVWRMPSREAYSRLVRVTRAWKASSTLRSAIIRLARAVS
ncbi:hypothetical protein D3C72_2340040 [compost metagenome]